MANFPPDVLYDGLAVIKWPDENLFPANGIKQPRASQTDGIRYYALTDGETTRIEGDAVGVAYGDDVVVVAIAIFDVESSLSSDAFTAARQTSQQVQHDFFYSELKAPCRFQSRGPCQRRHTCTYFHGDPGEARYLGRSVRTTPPAMKYMKGLGLQWDAPRYAIVMKATFPFSGDLNAVDFGNASSVEFSSEAVTLSAPAWTDSELKRNFSADMAVIKRFCEQVSGLPGPFESVFDANVLAVKEPQAIFDQEQQRWRLNLTRESISLRRFLTDVTLDYFNEQAVNYLAARKSQLPILGEAAVLERQAMGNAAAYFDDLSALPAYRVGRFNLSTRVVLGAMNTSVEYTTPSDAFQPTAGTLKYFKFTSPLRDFICLHNLSVLLSAMTGGRAPSLSKKELEQMDERRGLLKDKEREKVRHARDSDVDAAARLTDIAVRLDDQHSFFLHAGDIIEWPVDRPFAVVPAPY